MIYFVIGPPSAGKSYFIKHAFQDAVVVDLYDFQWDGMSIQDVADSYKAAEDALVSAVQNNKDKTIVFEHTLLKAERRKPYIEAVRKVSDEPIICLLFNPDEGTYQWLCRKRGISVNMMAFDILEKPDVEEGFQAVYEINPRIR